MIIKFEIQDVIDYIAGEMPSETQKQFEVALQSDELLKEQYDSLLPRKSNIIHNSALKLTDQWVSSSFSKISSFIAESNTPKLGDIYRINNSDDVVIVSAEPLSDDGLVAYRVVPLTSNDTFADQYDIVFQDNGYQNRVAVAHTHLAFGLLGTIPGIKRGKLNSGLITAIRQLSYGSKATLPEGASFGTGVHSALQNSYNDWVEVMSERFYSLSMNNLKEYEEKSQLEKSTEQVAKVNLDKMLFDAIFLKNESNFTYSSAASSLETDSANATIGKTLYKDEHLTIRLVQIGKQAPMLTLQFNEPTREVTEIAIAIEGGNSIVRSHLRCIDNGVFIPFDMNVNDKNSAITLTVKTNHFNFVKTFIFESE